MRVIAPACVGLSLLALAISAAVAQQRTAPVEGLKENLPDRHALSNARIWLGPGEIIENGTLLIEDGRITGVGRNVRLPAGTPDTDVGGRTLYPAFVELVSDYGVDPGSACTAAAPAAAPPPGPGRRGAGAGGPPAAATPQAAAGRHWNAKVCAERDLAAKLVLDEERAKKLRAAGFGAVLSAPKEGVLRGQSALLSLKPKAGAAEVVLADHVAQHAALEQVFSFGGEYPGSLMGANALLRQAFLDARWQQTLRQRNAAERLEYNQSLVALEPLLAGRQPLVWHARDELDYPRAAALANEFGLKLVLVGTGAEYRRLDQLAAIKAPLIVPLNLPAAPAVDETETALDVSLAELAHWHDAPFNARELKRRGLNFALTSDAPEAPEENFGKHLRKAIQYGLAQDDALVALTRTPAAILGESDRLGALKVGALANVLVADENWPAAEDAKLYEVWVEGRREELKPLDAVDFAGSWTVPGSADPWEISGTDKLKVKAGKDTEFEGKVAGKQLVLQVPGKAWTPAGKHTEIVELRRDGDTLVGRRLGPDGVARPFSATRKAAAAAAAGKAEGEQAADKKPVPDRLRTVGYPAGEYGRAALPRVEEVVFRDATVWMTGAEQASEDTDVLVRDGRIAAVGPDLDAGGAREIDARGKHLTPGLIDAHSHIAGSGNINEPSHSVTSEVRIGDIVDPTDIDIYRQLAGGVTTAHVMHGSANTIGGQGQIIQLRWGGDAEQLKFARATPTIKFALGENPKQSNWGDNFRSRYPQTRMGVEQVLIDSFNAAQAYAGARDAATKDKRPFRRDLRLEALAEILAGQRMVHIHSYRADEILMFVRLAERYGIKGVTFQHVLEGYKVAPELAKAGFGTSSFSDWWGYKLEVYDAIPQNNALLVQAGVLASTNSDSNDLARRLNTEAAKAQRYGGLTPVQALSLVTIGPARQLRIDAQVGTIEKGKQADLVLWSAPPLSSFARVEQTWIGGARYFDQAEDAATQQRIQAERAELIELARAERAAAPPGGPGKGPPGKKPPGVHLVFDFSRGYPSTFTAARPIYHDGEPVHLCRAGE